MLYISGTHARVSDYLDDSLLVRGAIRQTARYREAMDTIADQPIPRVIVGHSLGAAVARAIGHDLDVTTREWNNPLPSWRGSAGYRQRFDPISILDRGATIVQPVGLYRHGFGPAYEYFTADG